MTDLPVAVVRRLVLLAYDAGWSDACADHTDQRTDPDHPLGDSRVRDVDQITQFLDPHNLLVLRGMS